MTNSDKNSYDDNREVSNSGTENRPKRARFKVTKTEPVTKTTIKNPFEKSDSASSVAVEGSSRGSSYGSIRAGSDSRGREDRPYSRQQSAYGSSHSENSNFERPRRVLDTNSHEDSNHERPRLIKKEDLPADRPVYDRSTSRQPSRSSSYGSDSRGGYRGGSDRPSRPTTQGGYKSRPSRYKKEDNFVIPKPVKYEDDFIDVEAPLRLNKFLANAGVCSRREADEFIKAGVVTVNGEVITELGTKIERTDTVLFHNKPVSIENKIYIVLNKPKNCVTTTDDPQERKTVLDLVKNACPERIYPVGRLDRATTGVLLLTNDGDLASKLTHPQYAKKKIYHVWLDKDISLQELQQIADGIDLEDGPIFADAISYVIEGDKTQVGIEIHSGRNRLVRRIFEHLGFRVMKLDRVLFAGLTKKNLPRGKWRHLTQKEVNMLRMGAFE